MKVGILALQGDYNAHHQKLLQLGATPILIRRASEVLAISGIVFPGGESTTMLKLLDQKFRESLIDAIRNGLPTLATCAGCILLAKKVDGPSQDSFGLIDIDVTRNAYGRQVDSFVDPGLKWTEPGKDMLKQCNLLMHEDAGTVEGVFIRAPKISRVGEGVEVLIKRQDEPVFVREGNVLAGTFHPELSEGESGVHRMFLGSLR